MNLRKSIKFLAFLTSYLPLWIILSITQLFNEDSEGNFILKPVNKYISYPTVTFDKLGLFFFIVTIISLIFISSFLYIIQKEKKIGQVEYWKVTKIEDKDSDLLSYIFTYIIPFISSNGQKSFIIQILLICIVGIFYITSNTLIIFNPTLRIFGYFIYRVELSKEVEGHIIEKGVYLISKQRENDIKKNVNKKIYFITSDIIY